MKSLSNLILVCILSFANTSFSSEYLDAFKGCNTNAAVDFFNLSNDKKIIITQEKYEKDQSSIVHLQLYTRESSNHQKLMAELDFEIIPEDKVLQLDSIYVTKEYRKNKLGTRLFDFLKVCCIEYGCNEIKGDFGFVHKESTDYTEQERHDTYRIAQNFYKEQGCELLYSTDPTLLEFHFSWKMPEECAFDSSENMPEAIENEYIFLPYSTTTTSICTTDITTTCVNLHENNANEKKLIGSVWTRINQKNYIYSLEILKISENYKQSGYGTLLFKAAIKKILHTLDNNSRNITWLAYPYKDDGAALKKLVLWYKKLGGQEYGPNNIREISIGSCMRLSPQLIEEYVAIFKPTLPSHEDKVFIDDLHESLAHKRDHYTLWQELFAKKLHKAQQNNCLTDCAIQEKI